MSLKGVQYNSRNYIGLANNNPKLSGEANWSSWKDDMELLFNADGGIAFGIITGETPRPEDPEQGAVWDMFNKGCLSIMWIAMEQDVKDELGNAGIKKADLAWKHLKVKYEKTNWARRVRLRAALHSIQHNPDQPMSIYIESLQKLRRQLKDIGVEIDDAYIKDILLTNLHQTYHTVRTNLLSSPDGEPTLTKVIDILTTASPVVNFDLESAVNQTLANANIKSEPTETALATRLHARAGRVPFRGGGSRSGGGGKGKEKNFGRTRRGESDSSGSENEVDGFVHEGIVWGSMSNDGCHRCGIPGHKATWCIADMPDKVKDWCRKMRKKSEKTHVAFERSYSPSIMEYSHIVTESSPLSSRSSSPPTYGTPILDVDGVW